MVPVDVKVELFVDTLPNLLTKIAKNESENKLRPWLENGLQAVGDDPSPARDRLTEMLDFYLFMGEQVEELLEYLKNIDNYNISPWIAIVEQTEAIGDPATPMPEHGQASCSANALNRWTIRSMIMQKKTTRRTMWLHIKTVPSLFQKPEP